MKGEPATSIAAPPIRTRAEAEAMIRENRGLIFWTISRFGPPRMNDTEREDLEAECLVGLWYAALKYRPEMGRFSSFAVPKIRGRICGWLTTQNRKKRRIDREALSLSTPLHAGEEGATLEDTLPDPRAEFEERIIARVEIDRSLMPCSERERRILRALGDGMTLDAVGGLEGGVSRERVRQIRDRALQKIKRAIKR